MFGVSINTWRLAGDILNITCNFLYCNHQLHRGFLITLHYEHNENALHNYKKTITEVYSFLLVYASVIEGANIKCVELNVLLTVHYSDLIT
jgi:hypothetical protein